MTYVVKRSTLGYLNDDQTRRADSPRHAAEMIRSDFDRLFLDLADSCDRFGCGICGWCRASARVRDLRNGLTETVAAAELRVSGTTSWVVEAPGGKDLVIWAEQTA